jgi:hypothetical protein
MKFLTLGLFALALTFNSCKKDKKTIELEPEPTSSGSVNTTNLQALIRNLSTPLQTYTINAGTYNTLTLNNGTRIVIAPNAFLTAGGSVVTGVVNVEAKDVLSKKDMVLNNAFPVSNGQLLISGGEVYFNATQGGQTLKINAASSVTYKVPAGSSPSSSMLEFYSSGTSDLSGTNLNWRTSAVTTASVLPLMDSASGPSSWIYDFKSDSIGWSNCDFFYTFVGAKTTCTVNLAGSFDNTNSFVLISMNGVSTMARLSSSYTSVSNEFHSYVNSIPVGQNYTIVAISFDGTNYYYGSQAVTMTTDMVINMPTLSLSSKTGVEANLSTLP